MEALALSPVQADARAAHFAVLIDQGVDPERAALARWSRFSAAQSAGRLHLIGLRRPYTLPGVHAVAGVFFTDHSARLLLAAHAAALRAEADRIVAIRDWLATFGHSSTLEFVDTTVHRALRLVPDRWPADLVLVASRAWRLPARTAGVTVERLVCIGSRRSC